MNNDVSDEIHSDNCATGSERHRRFTVCGSAAEIERLCGGRRCEAARYRALRSDRAASARRLRDGASIVALSPTEEGFRFRDSRDSFSSVAVQMRRRLFWIRARLPSVISMGAPCGRAYS